MATPDGKVTFEAEGRTQTLRFTTNALCLLEDKLDKTTLDIATELQFNPRVTTIRAMFWAALGETDRTMADIGKLIDDIGLPAATKLAREAYAAAFPDAEEAKKDGEGKANPPIAAAG